MKKGKLHLKKQIVFSFKSPILTEDKLKRISSSTIIATGGTW